MSFWLVEVLSERRGIALACGEQETSNEELVDAIRRWGEVLDGAGVAPGDSVAVIADFRPSPFALLLALAARGNVVVPLRASAFATTPLFESGLDSLGAVDLRNRLERAFERKLPATLVFEQPTLETLTAHLHALLSPQREPRPEEKETVDVLERSIAALDKDAVESELAAAIDQVLGTE